MTAASAPANAIHWYQVCIKGIDARLPDRQGTRGPYGWSLPIAGAPPVFKGDKSLTLSVSRLCWLMALHAMWGTSGLPWTRIRWRVAAVVNHPMMNCGSNLCPACLMIRPRTPTLMPIVPMPLQRAQMKKSRQSPFVGVPATNDHVHHATCVILRPGGVWTWKWG